MTKSKLTIAILLVLALADEQGLLLVGERLAAHGVALGFVLADGCFGLRNLRFGLFF